MVGLCCVRFMAEQRRKRWDANHVPAKLTVNLSVHLNTCKLGSPMRQEFQLRLGFMELHHEGALN